MRLIRLPQVKGMTEVGRSSVYQLMSEGKFPKAVTLIGRAGAWGESEVIEWIEARVAERDGNSSARKLKGKKSTLNDKMQFKIEKFCFGYMVSS